LYNPFDLKGARFLVTGAASGIGRSTCNLISKLNGRVIGLDINEEGLKELLLSLEGEGHSIYCFDLRDVDKIPHLIAELVAQGGLLSGFVHAAGVHCIYPVRLLESGAYRPMLQINTEAALGLTRGFQRNGMYNKQGSSIVFISSVMAFVGSSGASAYSLSKSALVGLSKSLALELAPKRIRVNCVVPGFIKTPMFERVSANWDSEQRLQVEKEHPLGLGEPDDVANAIVFLLAESGKWITGSALVVDGGYTAH